MRERITAIKEWVQGLLPVRVIRRHLAENGLLLAQGLSWKAVFATFAALWVGFAISGFWLRQNPPLRDALLEWIATAVPGLIDTGEGGAVQLDQLLSASVLGWTGAVAAIGLIWTTVGWFSSARTAVRTIAGLDRDSGNFILLKLRDGAMTIGFGIAILASAALSLGSTALLETVFRFVGIDNASQFSTLATRAAGLVIVLAVDWLVLWLFFRFAAQVRTSRRAMLQGTGLGALALGALKVLGGLLLGGATSNPLLASFAVIIGLLIWFNLISQIILIAAAWVAEAGGLGRRAVVETGSRPPADLAM